MCRRYGQKALLVVLVMVAFPGGTRTTTTFFTKAFEFNFEVERRVYEGISSFMDIPTHVVDQLAAIQKNDYYDLMDYLDRDSYASTMFTLSRMYGLENLYYGTEGGMFYS